MADIYPQGIAVPTADVQRLLEQSYGSTAISPDILAQYGQGMQDRVAPPPPQIEQYRGLQPIPGRQEYYNMVQQRFNELADMVGGIDVLAKTNHVETARKAAMDDIAMMYGPPPSVQPQMQVQQIPGTNRVVVSGGGFTAPQLIETAPPQAQGMQLQPLYTSEGQKIPGKGVDPSSGKVIEFDDPQAKSSSDYEKASEMAEKAKRIVEAVNSLLINPETKEEDLGPVQWASGFSGKFAPMFFPSVVGTKEQIGNLESLVKMFSRKELVGQGAGSISDAEQEMAGKAATQLITQGSDEQMIKTLKDLRTRFMEMQQRFQGQMEQAKQGLSLPTGTSSQASPPVQPGYTREVWSGNKRTPAQ